MKFRNYLPASAASLLAAGFLLIVLSACRQSPTGPNTPVDTTHITNGDSCCHASITVHVHDSASGARLQGAKVTLSGANTNAVQTATTNADGAATFINLCPGRYVLHTTYTTDNGTSVTKESVIELTCNQQWASDVNLAIPVATHTDCCSGVAELGVHDSLTGSAINGAIVRLYMNGQLLDTALTTQDRNGGVRFANLCEGNYRMTIDKDGYHEGVEEWTETCNSTHGFNYALYPVSTTSNCDNASISLHVDSASTDHALQGVKVMLYTVTSNGTRTLIDSGYTTDGGNFSVSHLLGHTTYQVVLSKDGYHTTDPVITVGDCINYSETYGLNPQ